MKATQNPPTIVISQETTPADLLRGAAQYLTRYGWLQGDFFDLLAEANFPPACSLGAIKFAAYGRPFLDSDNFLSDIDPVDDQLADNAIRAMRVLASHLCPEYENIDSFAYQVSAIDVVAGWNDEDGRTLTEVIEALNDAANDWEATHPTGGAR
ncbi:DUF6197 family protein [Paractinoplanes aksuensis]